MIFGKVLNNSSTTYEDYDAIEKAFKNKKPCYFRELFTESKRNGS